MSKKAHIPSNFLVNRRKRALSARSILWLRTPFLRVSFTFFLSSANRQEKKKKQESLQVPDKATQTVCNSIKKRCGDERSGRERKNSALKQSVSNRRKSENEFKLKQKLQNKLPALHLPSSSTAFLEKDHDCPRHSALLHTLPNVFLCHQLPILIKRNQPIAS